MAERGVAAKGRGTSPDLFAAAATDRLAARGPAGRPAAAADARRHRRPAPPGGARTHRCALLVETGPAHLGHPVGTAGHREDDAGRGGRGDDGQGLRAPVGGERRGGRRPRRPSTTPGGCWVSRAGGRSSSSTRSTGSTRRQQDALLPAVEEGLVVLIGATTENPFFSVNSPLLSRSTLWRLEPLGDDDIAEVVRRGPRGRGGDGRPTRRSPPWCRWPTATPAPRSGTLEVALALAGTAPVTAEDVDRARAGPAAAPGGRRPLRPGRARSSSPSGGPTPTPGCTGWPGCSRPARTPGSSPGAW